MNLNDKSAFAIEWRKANAMFNRDISADMCNYAFELLAPFSLPDVIAGIRRAVCLSEFPPTVAAVVDAIKHGYKLDEETLKAQGESAYYMFKHVDSGCDTWVEDARAVAAFKRAFGSLLDYCRHDVTAEPFDRKNFIDAYVHTARGSFDPNDPSAHLLWGAYAFTDDPRVAFIGNEDICKGYAVDYYTALNKHPRYPLSKAQRLTMQKQREQLALEDMSSKPVTHEQLERLWGEVEKILNVKIGGNHA